MNSQTRLILLFLLSFLLYEIKSRKVINNCGKKGLGNEEPKAVEDCKDENEKNCRFVSVIIYGQNVSYCANIHGKYNNEDVINAFKSTVSDYGVTDVVIENGKGNYLFSSIISILIGFLLLI